MPATSRKPARPPQKPSWCGRAYSALLEPAVARAALVALSELFEARGLGELCRAVDDALE
jgi:hypothetical protein